MINSIKNKEDFCNGGIYYIKNLNNGKIYIGSTKCFKNRYYQHCSKLKNNKHHNIILQNIYNKYGKEILEFGIVEIVSTDIIEKETFYINYYQACENGYNINPTPINSPSNLPNVKNKISKTLKEKYNNKELLPTLGCFKKGNTPWNKNKTYTESEKDKMKVPKTRSKALEIAWENSKLYQRAIANEIHVYDVEYNLLYISNSLSDLQEWSCTESNNLPINSRHGKKLVLEKVCKACKSGKLYKGLYFKSVSKPRIEEIL